MSWYGPVPIGSASNPSGSASTAAFGTILTTARRSASTPVGNLRVKVTVVSSVASTESMNGMNWVYSEALSGFSTRSKENTTSSVVTGEPSWNTAPSRRATVQVVSSTYSGSPAASAL